MKELIGCPALFLHEKGTECWCAQQRLCACSPASWSGDHLPLFNLFACHISLYRVS